MSSHRALIELAYRSVLGRDVEPDMLAARVAALEQGASFDDMFVEIATSEEANSAKSAIVRLAYAQYLKREASQDEISSWTSHLNASLSIEAFLAIIAGSEEARLKFQQTVLGPNLSDGQFMIAASAALFGRGLLPTEVVAWQRRLESSGETRSEIAGAVINDKIRSFFQVEDQAPIAHDPDLCWIMGTTRTLTKKQWQERAEELDLEIKARPDIVPLEKRTFNHSGSVDVSMIASLYKGGGFIGKFLENISSQTIFDRSELIIVDADSPEREWETIEAYQKVYPNIVYKRINYRLGIYDAWNVGVELSRGRYLTNTNLDDLRRSDSIELQAGLLDANPSIDVVYQDFYYSFDPELDFEQVAAFGFKSELPIITPHNLLLFNSPHNAPMWRKSLHADLGPFDIRYRSAGDYEFWARCMAAGKAFRKINTPHVVYYQNPQGISTRPDTRGVQEAHDILSRYGKALTSTALIQSRRDFLAGIGVDTDGLEADDRRSYYEIVQDELYKLAASRPAPACRDNAVTKGNVQPLEAAAS